MQSKRWLMVLAGLLCFLLGIGIALYPAFSDWYMTRHQGQAIKSYQQTLSHLTDRQMREAREQAIAYNEGLVQSLLYGQPADQSVSYDHLLNLNGDGMMGYIEIPKIEVCLPIYHGTDAESLSKGAGHLLHSSLPVGGASCHSVLSAHCGDPSAQLFTHLEELETGDRFMLLVLDQELTYEVDQIKVVSPENTEDLQIAEGKDYVTLVTCTPYGINSHRLLVRGCRIFNQEEDHIVEAEVEMGEKPFFDRTYIKIAIAIAIAIAIVVLGFLIGVIRKWRNSYAQKQDR